MLRHDVPLHFSCRNDAQSSSGVEVTKTLLLPHGNSWNLVSRNGSAQIKTLSLAAGFSIKEHEIFRVLDKYECPTGHGAYKYALQVLRLCW